MTGSTADTDLADRPKGVTASMRQFFGVTRHYPGPGIEIRFSAPAEPVRVAELQQVLRAQLPRWEDTLPDQLPAEEAVARLARTIVANKIATWSRFRREDGIGIAALGIAVSPSFIAALLSALSRALIGGEQARVAALRQIEQLAMTLLRGRWRSTGPPWKWGGGWASKLRGSVSASKSTRSAWGRAASNSASSPSMVTA